MEFQETGHVHVSKVHVPSFLEFRKKNPDLFELVASEQYYPAPKSGITDTFHSHVLNVRITSTAHNKIKN